MSGWGKPVVSLAIACALVGTAVASPRSQVAKGNHLYREGKYQDAIQQYGEALVDDPESPIAHFNMAAAQYKAGKFDAAIASLQKVDTAGDEKRAAEVAYNLGNAYFRRGEKAADKDPQAAITAYGQALTAYKRAMSAEPSDARPKFNHEFVQAKLEQLKKRLEEQKKQQQNQPKKKQQNQQQQKDQQKQQDQQQSQEQQKNQQQQQQDQSQKDQQQAQQDQQKSQQQDQQQQAEKQKQQEEQQQQAQNESPSDQTRDREPQQAQAAAAATADKKDQQDKQQAQAIIDTAREEELRPDEVNRHLGTAVVGQPLEDW